MKQYDFYKPTGLFWLPEIPSLWAWRYLSQTAKEQNIKKPQNETLPVMSLSYGNIIRKKNIDAGLVPTNYDNYQVIHSGNIILRLTDLQNDHTSLRTGLVKETGIITSAYTCLLPTENAAYLQYLLHAYDTRKVFYGMGGGVRQSIGYKDIRNMGIPIPLGDEQDQIVRYLDWQVSKTNKLISALKKQIALLKEQKQAVINEAVTKGLDPSVPMKDSGVDWVGEIPAHWRITKIGNHFTIKKRIARSEGFSVLSITQQGLKIKDISTNEGQMAANYSGYQFVYPGEFAMNHMDLLTGYIDISTYHGVTSPDYRVFGLEDTDNCLAEYYLYLFQLCYKRRIFYGFGRGAANQGRWRMPAVNFRNFIMPLPEYDEQAQIVAHLNEQCAEVDTLIENISNEIAVLGEYRTRLISDVVTGQIDVRAVEVPDFEYITDEAEGASDDENSDVEEAEEE